MLIATKLDWPKLGSNHIRRPRLLQQLAVGENKRLTMISAPAGFGKTTIVSESFQHSDHACAWLSLDKSDSNLSTFLAYFIASIQKADSIPCHNTQMMLQAPQLPALQQIADALLNDLAELTRAVTLVLDDYHLIRDRSVHELLISLVYRATDRLHLVIATRSDPPFPLSQWRARGYLVEIRATQLRFTLDETRAFLSREVGKALSEPLFKRISDSTEGWITGLKLAALSIRDRAAGSGDSQPLSQEMFDNISSRHISDFLLEDVLSRQPKHIQEFLIRASIVDRFTSGLCDVLCKEMTGTSNTISGWDVLKSIERSNLFLIALDEEQCWYRFHHLFRSLLENQLRLKHSESEIAGLHRRACAWFAGQGLMEEALQHALAARDFQGAADLIEQRKHEYLNREDWVTLQRWLDMLPDALVESRPALLLVRAMIANFRGQYAQLSAILIQVKHLLDHVPASKGMSTPDNPIDVQLLTQEYCVLSANVALLVRDDPQEAFNLLDGMWKHVPRSHESIRGNVMLMWAIASHFLGKFAMASRVLIAELDTHSLTQKQALSRTLLALIFIHAFEGQWDEVDRWGSQLLAVGMNLLSPLSRGWAHFWMGVGCYERNDLHGARAHFQENANHIESIHGLCAHNSLIGLILTHQALGEWTERDKAMVALASFDLEHAFAPYQAQQSSLQMRLAFLSGDRAGALSKLSVTDMPAVMGGHMQLMVFLEIPHLTVMRLLIARGRRDDLQLAESELEKLLAVARKLHSVRREIEILALLSLAQSAQGRSESALDALDAALGLAQPRAFVRTFIDLGPEMSRLLDKMVRANRQAQYAGELIGAYNQPRRLAPLKPSQKEELIEPLTNREMEILALMAKHLSNQEIALALFISPLTVKSHSRNLYEKLGVKRRRYAIRRAQELGLLTISPDEQ